MFDPQFINQLEINSNRPHPSKLAEHSVVESRTRHLFNQARANARMHRLLAFITRKPTSLINLSEALKGIKIQNRHDNGVQPVSMSCIMGTENRSSDFDDRFSPLSERTMHRWMAVAAVMLTNGALPAVELIEIGGYFFVRDGHHRISVARTLGFQSIDAHVTHWQFDGVLPWEQATAAKMVCQSAQA